MLYKKLNKAPKIKQQVNDAMYDITSTGLLTCYFYYEFKNLKAA